MFLVVGFVDSLHLRVAATNQSFHLHEEWKASRLSNILIDSGRASGFRGEDFRNDLKCGPVKWSRGLSFRILLFKSWGSNDARSFFHFEGKHGYSQHLTPSHMRGACSLNDLGSLRSWVHNSRG